MSDEYIEHDLDTPTEADLDQAYGSKYLSAADIGDRKIRTKIAKVGKDYMNDRETGKKKMKFLVFFDSIDKALVLNATNKNVLVDALGKAAAGWKGASVGIFNDPTVTFAGKKTGGLRLRVLAPPAKQAAAAPAAPAAATTGWPEEKGDPGFDPDLNDPVPEFAA